MAIGYARILKVGEMEDSAGIRVPQYQFIYNDGGNTYSRTLDEMSLIELLTKELALRPNIADAALKEVRREGRATIPDVEISENEAAAIGLQEVGSDY
jgi:hypothetical protein